MLPVPPKVFRKFYKLYVVNVGVGGHNVHCAISVWTGDYSFIATRKLTLLKK